jgi:hypothetical protein
MKFKKIKYFKNFISDLDFNFDTLTDILNTSELHQYIKAEPTDTINFRKVFDHIYQVKKVETTAYLNPIYNLLIDKTKNYFAPGDFDLFISFKAVKGCAHHDKENVIILGLCGITEYYFPLIKKSYFINKGDALYIPSGTPHCASSNTARIVASLSLYR